MRSRKVGWIQTPPLQNVGGGGGLDHPLPGRSSKPGGNTPAGALGAVWGFGAATDTAAGTAAATFGAAAAGVGAAAAAFGEDGGKAIAEGLVEGGKRECQATESGFFF